MASRKTSSRNTVSPLASSTQSDRTTYKGHVIVVSNGKDFVTDFDIKTAKLDSPAAVNALIEEVQGRYPGCVLTPLTTEQFQSEPVLSFRDGNRIVLASVSMRHNQCPTCGSTKGRKTCPTCGTDPYSKIRFSTKETPKPDEKPEEKSDEPSSDAK